MQLGTGCLVQVVADNPLSKLTGIYQTEVLRILVGPVHSQVGVKMYPHSYLHYTCSPSFQKEVGVLFCSRMCGCRKSFILHYTLGGYVTSLVGSVPSLGAVRRPWAFKCPSCPCTVFKVPSVHMSSVMEFKIKFLWAGPYFCYCLDVGGAIPGPGCGMSVTEGVSLDNVGTCSSMLFGFGVSFSLRCSQKQQGCNLWVIFFYTQYLHV